MESKPNINVDEILVIVEEIIPETKPKTRVGRWFRWIDKIIKLKILSGIKISK